jgi:hypothetical protein
MSTRRRLAAGICVLSVALLAAGFGSAVAIADPETGDSVSGTEGQQAGQTATEPTGSTPGAGGVDTIPKVLGTVFDTEPPPSSGHEATNEESHDASPGPTGPMALGVTADTQSSGAAAVDDNNKSSDTVQASATTEETNKPEAVISSSPVTEPSQESQASAADADPPATAPANDPPVEEPAPVQPVANEAPLVGDAATSVPAEPPPPVVGAAQANSVITALAYFFITLADDGIQLIKLPGALLSLLGVPLTGDVATASLTAGGIGGSLFAGGLRTATPFDLASSWAVQAGWPEMLIAPGDSSSLSSAGVFTHLTPGGLAASGAAEEHSGLSAVLADGIAPEQVRALLQHVVDAVLAPLSLLALAALASPGVVGLVLLGVAGMGIGYRQAKAASMLRAVSIARFVKAGPLGVVRSGGLVAVHPRAARAERRQPRRTADFLSPVA